MKIIALIILSMSLSFSMLWDIHAEGTMYVDQYIPEKIEVASVDVTLLVRTAILLGVHVMVDRLGNEEKQGYWMEKMAVTLGIMYYATPEKEKGRFLYCAAMAITPDTPPLKPLFHYDNYQSIINMTPGAHDLLTQLILLNYVVMMSETAKTSVQVGFDKIKILHEVRL